MGGGGGEVCLNVKIFLVEGGYFHLHNMWNNCLVHMSFACRVYEVILREGGKLLMNCYLVMGGEFAR